MKNLIILLIALFCCQFAQAQNYRQIKRPNTRIQKIPKYKLLKPIVIMKPDLTVLNNIRLVHNNGKRYLYADVKNIGNLKSNKNSLQLRISWRVDHESFTNVERFKNYSVPYLNPGQKHTLCVLIPDNEIHSNEGYGSNSASFRFFADRSNVVSESVENNNMKYKLVPILRD